MPAIPDEAQCNGLAGIVGVCDKIERQSDSDHLDEREHLVGELAFAAIGEDETFVDAYRERDSEGAYSGPDNK